MEATAVFEQEKGQETNLLYDLEATQPSLSLWPYEILGEF